MCAEYENNNNIHAAGNNKQDKHAVIATVCWKKYNNKCVGGIIHSVARWNDFAAESGTPNGMTFTE